MEMDDRLMVNWPVQPGRSVEQQKKGKTKTPEKKPDVSFKEVMNKELQEKTGVNFSKHAQNRIISRGIDLAEEDLELLGDGVDKAREKGARDTLIMVNSVAYVVSIENKTVITAIDGGSIRDNVFTNIDSAVFM